MCKFISYIYYKYRRVEFTLFVKDCDVIYEVNPVETVLYQVDLFIFYWVLALVAIQEVHSSESRDHDSHVTMKNYILQ